MANTTPSTYMSLPVPVVGMDPGPQYGADLNTCFTLIDIHNHANGSGAQISPSGLNINSDLTFQNNQLTLAKTVGFTVQLSDPATLGALYYKGVDLYFNDGSGNHIQVTSSGAVAGTPGSIASLTSPASATYVAGSTKFLWQGGTNKAAAMDSGELFVRETNVTSANYVNIKSPTSLSANYALTLPTALPGSTQYLALSAVGAMSTVSADSIGSAMTATGANAIQVSSTRATGTSVGVQGVAISSSSGNQSSSNATAVDITNLSVTLTTSGRPVMVLLVPDGTANDSQIQVRNISGSVDSAAAMEIYIYRDAVLIGQSILQVEARGDGGVTVRTGVPPGFLNTIDAVIAGTYVYKIQARLAQGSTFFFQYCKLTAYEL